MQGTSLDIVKDLIDQLKQVVPQAFTEDKLDIDQLKTLLGEGNTADGERYGLSWAGKSEAYKVLQTATTTTLNPEPDKSIKWDETENVLIEGENLEVLKVLQKSYYGRIKMIYIDPPYNTGNDSFIYPDKFSETKEDYLKRVGDKDDEGLIMREGFFRKNSKENGQYHSNWLNMMLPRLFLARNLLKEDGIIFVSIDDNEQTNLKLLMDEIFGPENFVATLVWEKGRKNDAKFFSVGHEYILTYARSLQSLREHQTVWREEKPGARDIWQKYLELRKRHNKDDAAIEGDLSDWYANLPKNHPAKKWSRYKRVDANGPWRDRDISWPSGDGPRYDVIHPKTGLPCAVPEPGWRFSKPEEMQRQIDVGLVEFRADHTQPPFRKAHIKPIAAELDTDDTTDDEDEEDEGFATQVRGSYFYKQSQVSVKYLRGLMGAIIFNNPKDHEELARLFEYVMGEDKNGLILDFFAGSGSTAQAVLELNEQDGGNRRFICVQLPEETDPKSKAYKTGFATIADITQERIKRVIAKIEKIRNGSLELDKRQPLGFRKYRLEGSNFKIWRGDVATNEEELKRQMALFTTPQRANATTQNILWELLIKNGYPLTEKVQTVTLPDGEVIYHTQDKRLALVLDVFTQATQDAILALAPKAVLMLDSLFTGRDNDKTNAQLKFEDNGISFRTV